MRDCEIVEMALWCLIGVIARSFRVCEPRMGGGARVRNSSCQLQVMGRTFSHNNGWGLFADLGGEIIAQDCSMIENESGAIRMDGEGKVTTTNCTTGD